MLVFSQLVSKAANAFHPHFGKHSSVHVLNQNRAVLITIGIFVNFVVLVCVRIGMDPNWRHIIPPGQDRVISQGHCMEDCTGSAFPPQGINIFAVMMRTHQIGREIKLRQVRHSLSTIDRETLRLMEKFNQLSTWNYMLPEHIK